jgi:hypothetical protein
VIVSSLSRRLGRLAGALRPNGGTATFELFGLHSDIFDADGDRAEGLAWVQGLGWLVALDLKRDGPNLFRLGELPP